MRTPFVVTFAALATLSCAKATPEPPPEAAPSPLPSTTPSPSPVASQAPPPDASSDAKTLPTWDEARLAGQSVNTGRTNPPGPVLLASPAGDCFLHWEGGMVRGKGDRVEDCGAVACGTPVQCPPPAAALLKGFKPGAPVISRQKAYEVGEAAFKKKNRGADPPIAGVQLDLKDGSWVFNAAGLTVTIDPYTGKVTKVEP